jgi:hypothetical protein
LLFTLENYLGTETMLACMREYVNRWRFKHPTTKDFVQVFNETSGQNLDWFFDQALYSRATVDYAVAGISSNEIVSPHGFDFTMKTTDTTATNGQEDDESKSDSGKGDEDSTRKQKPKSYESKVNIRRLGEFVFPVEVLVKFDDGEEVRELWDGRELWKKFIYQKSAKLVSATIDPDKKIWLDVNMSNNSRTLEPNMLGVNKLAARWMFWMQFMLDSPEWLLLSRGVDLDF